MSLDAEADVIVEPQLDVYRSHEVVATPRLTFASNATSTPNDTKGG